MGAGGVQGGAWLTGALAAIAEETGWDPATADYVVGTSAGSMIGSLIAAGLPPWFMVAHSAGESLRGDGRRPRPGTPPTPTARRAPSSSSTAGALPIFPGSLPLVARSLLRPHRHTPAGVLSGWAPRGMISSEPLREIVRSVVPGNWTGHPNHWVVACDYSTGRRVSFGRDGAPPAKLEDAVAASCSIPGFYRPVKIDGRLYVDGGIWSTSNLDVLRGQDLDLVICFNPTSSLHPVARRSIPPPPSGCSSTGRAAAGSAREAKRLRSEGTDVVLIQPTGRDLEAMGVNLMSNRNRNGVIGIARETVAEQLAEPEHRRLARRPAAGRPRHDPAADAAELRVARDRPARDAGRLLTRGRRLLGRRAA